MTPIKTTPKDFFIHLGIIIFLYISSISLLSLLFDAINIAFPDRLDYGYYDPYSASTRWAIASLIIIFPMLLVLSWLANRDMKLEPAKAELGIRKWLTYLTLFLTGLSIISDLVVLINTFLSGEISTRFVLKVLAVLVIIGIIFWYYMIDLKKSGGSYRKITAIAASVIVVVSIVSGFVIMGTPGKARALQFDERRVNDLQNIQQQITNYWQMHGQLPKTTADLFDSISGYQAAKDPETDAAYTYTPTAETSFKLCATFDEVTPKYNTPVYDTYGNMGNWQHGKGNVCFDRTIDKVIYPVSKDAPTPHTVPVNPPAPTNSK